MAAGGGFMANTLGIMTSSAFNSVGMYVLSGGMMQPSLSFGFGSINLETGEFNYLFDGNNKWYEDLGYAFGALANMQDIAAGFNGTDITVNSADVKQEWWGHSSVTDQSGNIDVSVGPTHQVTKNSAFSVIDGKLWSNYANDPSTWKVGINNVNSKLLTNMTNNIRAGDGLFGWGKLNWNILGFSCVNHAARALWAVGIPTLPINLHPLILNFQLVVRQAGIYASPYLTTNKY
jgi:hypothetical protein